MTVPLTALTKTAETVGFPDTVTPDAVSHPTDPATARTDLLTDPVTVTLTRAVDVLREQLVIANARAERAERRVDELRAELAEERRLIAILTGPRVPWWRRFVPVSGS